MTEQEHKLNEARDYYYAKRGLGWKTSFEKLETDQYGLTKKIKNLKLGQLPPTGQASFTRLDDDGLGQHIEHIKLGEIIELPDGVPLVSTAHPLGKEYIGKHRINPMKFYALWRVEKEQRRGNDRKQH